MSLVAIFIVGTILFFFTTWASVAFGLSRMHELQSRDIATSPSTTIVDQSEFTEVHVTEPGTRTTDKPA